MTTDSRALSFKEEVDKVATANEVSPQSVIDAIRLLPKPEFRQLLEWVDVDSLLRELRK